MKTPHHLISLFVVLLAAANLHAQDPVLLEIDKKTISKSEFENIFKKNNRDSAITKADLDEYAELFINFKLKVAAAEEMGMDTMPDFQRELKGYRDQLAAPYLVDRSTTERLVEEAYERMKMEVRAAHILIRIPPDPSPEDTLKAFKKITGLKSQLKTNPDKFGELARTMSEDPSAKTNEGDLGYFTGMQMVYPFESAVYNAKKGDIVGPVRTQFGYHLVKVDDRRPARGEVRVAHIMIRVEESDSASIQTAMRARADEVYQKLSAGESFESLAKKYSDDRSSAAKGGELPAFGSNKMVAEFENAAFSIENTGEIAGPIKSPYGWHIIKLIERVPLQPYEAVQKELQTKISKDSRSNLSKDSFIQKRKEEYAYKEDVKMLKPFYTAIDTTYFKGAWEPNEKLTKLNGTLFNIADTKYTQQDFLRFMQSRMRPTRKIIPIASLVDESYAAYVDQSIMDYEDAHLEEKYPEFKALIGEYRDGILLFDLTDQKVWSKAVKDSAGLADYYTAHQTDFMWKERAQYDTYTVQDEATATALLKFLKKGKSQDYILEKLNAKSALAVKAESGINEKEFFPYAGQVAWAAGTYGPIDMDGQLQVIKIKEIKAPQPKDFNEARGIITAAYQNYLEQEWISFLRSSHEVKLYKEVLYDIQ